MLQTASELRNEARVYFVEYDIDDDYPESGGPTYDWYFHRQTSNPMADAPFTPKALYVNGNATKFRAVLGDFPYNINYRCSSVCNGKGSVDYDYHDVIVFFDMSGTRNLNNFKWLVSKPGDTSTGEFLATINAGKFLDTKEFEARAIYGGFQTSLHDRWDCDDTRRMAYVATITEDFEFKFESN